MKVLNCHRRTILIVLWNVKKEFVLQITFEWIVLWGTTNGRSMASLWRTICKCLRVMIEKKENKIMQIVMSGNFLALTLAYSLSLFIIFSPQKSRKVTHGKSVNRCIFSVSVYVYTVMFVHVFVCTCLYFVGWEWYNTHPAL